RPTHAGPRSGDFPGSTFSHLCPSVPGRIKKLDAHSFIQSFWLNPCRVAIDYGVLGSDRASFSDARHLALAWSGDGADRRRIARFRSDVFFSFRARLGRRRPKFCLPMRLPLLRGPLEATAQTERRILSRSVRRTWIF